MFFGRLRFEVGLVIKGGSVTKKDKEATLAESNMLENKISLETAFLVKEVTTKNVPQSDFQNNFNGTFLIEALDYLTKKELYLFWSIRKLQQV